jgi:hypothetical protein
MLAFEQGLMFGMKGDNDKKVYLKPIRSYFAGKIAGSGTFIKP